jgi:prepilin peptidase CpaA
MISPLSILLLAAALVALFVAAARDLKDRVIPDALVLTVLCAGGALRLTSATVSWLTPIIGVLVFLAMSFQAARNVVGGGDAKMMTAITFLFPPANVPVALVMIALAGGILSAAYLAAGFALRARGMRAANVPSRRGLLRAEAHRAAAGEPLPFAFAILAGVVCTLLLEAIPCFSAISSSTYCSL